jgi:hypothetical protein
MHQKVTIYFHQFSPPNWHKLWKPIATSHPTWCIVKRWNYSYNIIHYYPNNSNLLLTTSYQNKVWNNEAQETTSTRKTSQIQSASEKGKEYEKIVMNHWLAYLFGLTISFSKCSPTHDINSLINLSNWIRYCWTNGKPIWTQEQTRVRQIDSTGSTI